MTDIIEASKLTDCELSSNGESLRINLRKAGGELVAHRRGWPGLRPAMTT